jgi:hypothetical protein
LIYHKQRVNKMKQVLYSVLMASALAATMAAHAGPPLASAAAPVPAASSVAANTSSGTSVDKRPVINTPPLLVRKPGKLTLGCGKAKMTLRCANDRDYCSHTTLIFYKANGRSMILKKPRGIDTDNPAGGLACVKAKDGTPYFIVQYGGGCASLCEWNHFYTTQGKILTHSYPAIIGYADKAVPNNKEFDELYDKFGIGKPFPKINYVHW